MTLVTKMCLWIPDLAHCPALTQKPGRRWTERHHWHFRTIQFRLAGPNSGHPIFGFQKWSPEVFRDRQRLHYIFFFKNPAISESGLLAWDRDSGVSIDIRLSRHDGIPGARASAAWWSAAWQLAGQRLLAAGWPTCRPSNFWFSKRMWYGAMFSQR